MKCYYSIIPPFHYSCRTKFHLHASLHGMMVAAGPWFLIEKEWIDKSDIMQSLCLEEVTKMNYSLHDVDRKGEKGFHRIAEGFSTRPDSKAMRAFFMEQNNPDLPPMLEWPHPVWDEWHAKLQDWKNRLRNKHDTDDKIHSEIKTSGIISMTINDQMRLQWRFITAAVKQISFASGGQGPHGMGDL